MRRASSIRSSAFARLSAVIAVLGVVLFVGGVSGCRKPTEIVLSFTIVGPLPAKFQVSVERPFPYNDIPTGLPGFVTADLGKHGELILEINATSRNTLLSLLPSVMMQPIVGAGDLTLTLNAPGYLVDPPNAQMIEFTDGESKELKFTLAAVAPDAGAMDASVTVHDAATLPDLAQPVD